MEIREGAIKKANEKLTKHITDFLRQFERLERTTDNKLIGYCGGNAYLLHIDVAIKANYEKVDISTIV
jgi:hypothetical protein